MGRLIHPVQLFLLALLLLCWGCGGSSAVNPPDDNQQDTTPPPYLSGDVFAGVPEIPWDDDGELHMVSEAPPTMVEVLGAEYLQKHNAEVDGTALVLTGRHPDEEGEGPAAAWGLYKVTGLTDMRPLALNTECLPLSLGHHYFIGIADYTTGDWLEFGPISTPEYEIDLSGSDHRFISRLGNLYFVIVVPPEHSATHFKSTLFLEGGEEDPLLPGSPHELIATDAAFTDKVVIEWIAGEGADHYELFRAATDEFRMASEAEQEWVKIGTPETTRFEDHEVDPGRVYLYKARSVNEAGPSEFSNIDEGYTFAEGGSGGDPPGAPIELWASDGEYENAVKVSWDGGEGAQWFRIARQGVEPETEWDVIGETEGHFFWDENVEPGKHYRYKAQAVNEHGQSEWSNTDTGYAMAGGGGNPPGAPFELWASDGEYPAAVKVAWSGGEGAGWFRIARQNVEPESEWVVIGESETHEFWDENVDVGKHYRYKAQAANEHGQSEWSNTDTGYAGGSGGDPPGHPFELSASDGTRSDGVFIEWWGGEGANYFLVQRRLAETESEWLTIGDPTGHELLDTSAEPGVIYKYRAQAVNEFGSSDWSNIDTGFRGDGGNPPGAPFELWASDGEYPAAVKVAWGGGEGAGWFRIARQDVEPLTEWEIVGESETHEFWDESVVAGKHYRYKAQAVNEHGQSDWSNSDTGYSAGGGGGTDYSIVGSVMHGDRGLPCAVTLLVVGDDEITIEAGEDGHFAFNDLHPGLYIVYPHHPEFLFTPAYKVITLSAEHPIGEAPFSATVAEDTFRAFGFIYDLVPSEDGVQLVPLVNVDVVAWQEGTEFEHHVLTNEAGYFLFEDLPAGVVLFKPTKEGYVFMPAIHDALISGEGIPNPLNFRGNLAD